MEKSAPSEATHSGVFGICTKLNMFEGGGGLVAACGLTPVKASVMAGGEVMSAALQSTYPSPARAGVEEEVMSAALQST